MKLDVWKSDREVNELLAELARLRAANEHLEKVIAARDKRLTDEIALSTKYVAESERLRALLTSTGQNAIEAVAENERLRVALETIGARVNNTLDRQDMHRIAREALGK